MYVLIPDALKIIAQSVEQEVGKPIILFMPIICENTWRRRKNKCYSM